MFQQVVVVYDVISKNPLHSFGCPFFSSYSQVPAVMTDRYARLNHGYQGIQTCADYGMRDKPQACLDGSADAQRAVAMEQMISNILTFFTSSLMGSISDEYGRKGVSIAQVSRCMQLESLAADFSLDLQPRHPSVWSLLVITISSLSHSPPDSTRHEPLLVLQCWCLVWSRQLDRRCPVVPFGRDATTMAGTQFWSLAGWLFSRLCLGTATCTVIRTLVCIHLGIGEHMDWVLGGDCVLSRNTAASYSCTRAKSPTRHDSRNDPSATNSMELVSTHVGVVHFESQHLVSTVVIAGIFQRCGVGW